MWKNGYTSPNPVCIRISTDLFVVKLSVKTRKVTVTGPKGEITKDFRHMPVEMLIKKQATKKRKGLYLNIKMWFGGLKQSCSVSTLKSLINNMITGVTQVRISVPRPFISFSNQFNINNFMYRATDTA